jgi:hypothetical protein
MPRIIFPLISLALATSSIAQEIKDGEEPIQGKNVDARVEELELTPEEEAKADAVFSRAQEEMKRRNWKCLPTETFEECKTRRLPEVEAEHRARIQAFGIPGSEPEDEPVPPPKDIHSPEGVQAVGPRLGGEVSQDTSEDSDDE